MEGYIYKYKNFVLFDGGKIIAAATFNRIHVKTFEVIDLILIATDFQSRNQGLGKLMIEILRKLNQKIVLLGDNSRIGWYQNRGFELASHLWSYFKDRVLDFTESTFLISGFTDQEKIQIQENLN